MPGDISPPTPLSSKQSATAGQPEDDSPDGERAQERRLIERLRDGEIDAFTTLVSQHMSRITRLATYLLGSEDAAEDVVQSVFVQLWEHHDTIDPERPLRPYLLRAVQNRSFNERRAEAVRMKYQNQIQDHIAAGTISAMVPSPEEQILTEAVVQNALKQLPERRQLALRLRLAEGLTDAEVADVLGISPQAADRLTRRALTDLRDILLVSK